MSVRRVVVAHIEPLAAEGIAEALAKYPALVPVGVASNVADAERCAERADAVAVDERIHGSAEMTRRLLRRGLRVVVIGRRSTDPDEEGVVIAVDAPIAHLAAALAPGASPPPPPRGGLSRREEQVVRLAAKGLVCKEMAKTLGISPKTVQQYKTRAFKRLGVHNQAAAVAALAEGGIGPWSRSIT